MHARELLEVAAIVSAHGPALIRGQQGLSAQGIQQYWTASKCRLDRWGRGLRDYAQDAAQRDPTALRLQWPYLRGMLEEILTGEVLTRVWTAVVCSHDRRQGLQDSEPVARSVLIGHLEARHRVLMLLVRGPGIDAEAAVKLNHLRRRVERWTDLLVGHLAAYDDVSEFAIEPARAKDFAHDLGSQSQRAGDGQAWSLVLSSLRAAFQQGLAPVSPNADLNTRIASAILACFPAEMFDSTGLLQSLWLTRLYNTTSDVQGMLEDLLAPCPAHRSAQSPDSAGLRTRRFRE